MGWQTTTKVEVLTNLGISYDNFIQLSFFLEDLFRRRVELVTTESLSPYIGPHIMSEVEYVPNESSSQNK